MKNEILDKLIIASFEDANTGEVVKNLKAQGYKAIYLREKGHFLRNRNVVIIEFNHTYLKDVLKIIKEYKHNVVTETMPVMDGMEFIEHSSIINTVQIPVIHGGVSYFVLDVLQRESC